MRIFKTKWLARFARREGITDTSLRESIERAESGLIDADLGGGLIKQGVGRKGQGRSGGYRMIVGYRAQDRAFFIYGFSKGERENIAPDELKTAKEIASIWFKADADQIALGIAENELQEIPNDQKKSQPSKQGAS